MGADLRGRSMRGLFWAFTQQFGSQLVRIVFSIMLARILLPADFGLAGLAVLFYNFLQILARFGLGEGLIQSGKTSIERLNTLLRIHLGLCLLAAALAWFGAPLVANWYAEPELLSLIRMLSFSFLLSAGVVIPKARLEQSLRFDLLTRRALPATLLASAAGLAAALAGWGAKSLVLLLLAEQFFLALGLLPWLPRGKAAPLRELKGLLQYSWKLSAAGVLGFIGKNLDTALIGKWIGKLELGYYQLGFRLTRLPAQNLAGVLDRVLFPAFAEIKQDRPRIARAYGSALRAMSLLVLPLFTWAMFLVKPLVPLILGANWLAAIPVMQVFCLLAMVQTLGRSVNSVIQALGRSDLVLVWVLFTAPANLLAVWFSVENGIVAVALSLLLIRTLIHIGQQLVVTHLLRQPLHTLLLKEVSGLPLALAIAALHMASGFFFGYSQASQLAVGGLLLISGLVLVLALGPKGIMIWLQSTDKQS